MAYQKMEAWETPKGLDILRELARRGASDEDIAKSIGVAKATLYRWKTKSDAIRDALQDGKLVADLEVEAVLFKKATGFTVTDTKTICFLDKDTGEMVPGKMETTVKHVLPDTNAIIFWLKNRCPDLWKDKIVEENDATETQLNTYLNRLSDALKTSNPTNQVGNLDTNTDTKSNDKGDADAGTT